MSRILLVAVLLLLPAYAGCLSDDEAPIEEAPAVAQSAEDAGAKAGEAPVAPKDAYAVEGEAVAYPVPVRTNPARAPVVLDLSGSFAPADCRPLGFGPFEEQLAAASTPRRFRDVSDELKVGDVFSYHISLSYVNSAQNWGEIHAAYGIGNTVQQHVESTQSATEVLIEWHGQGFRASEDDMAWLFVFCDFGQMTQAIPYTFTATFTFAEGAVPAEAPLLLTVPEGATTLFVRGVPIDEGKGVMSHFRLFAPDDSLVCECALSSADAVASVPLAGAGDYVLIVDHTDNGFVSAALDIEPEEEMRALAAEWRQTSIFAADGGPVAETFTVDVGSVPLFMGAAVLGKDGAGAGKKTQLSVQNGRGEPLRASWGGHVTFEDPMSGGTAWLGFWPGDWEFIVDHHAFAPGAHTVEVNAEDLRGELFLFTRHYVR